VKTASVDADVYGMAGRKILAAAILVLALVPSAYLAWNSRDMPHLGYFHDDALYWVSAKSLAEGSGYRVPSLPDQPYQTRYPPLYPLTLSGIWRIQSEFPNNLPAAVLLGWLMLPSFVILARRVFIDLGVDRRLVLVLCGVLALNPFVAFFSISLMSDVMFTCLLLAALILAERAAKPESKAWWAAAAGLLGGLSYLARAASLPLLASAPLCFLLRGQYRRAIVFAGAMLPAVAGWQLWVRTHLQASSDLVSLFYLNYLGYYFENMSWSNLPVFVWKNCGEMFSAAGSLIVFETGDSFWATTLRRLLACGAIAGAIRLARLSRARHYSLFAACYVLLLLIWHYPPNERFLLPVFPLLLAGFSTEVVHLLGLVRRSVRSSKASQRVTAGLTAAALAGLAGLAVFTTYQALGAFLPELFEKHRQRLASDQPVYEWISNNLPADSTFLAYHDPVLYLHTGRRATSLRVPPKLAYREDWNGIQKLFDSLPDIAEQQKLRYLFLHSADYERDLPEAKRIATLQVIRENPRFRPLVSSPTASVYRIENP
jgi:4-amino-4-deoxy-L-arabinose transferase-like glycosyltransferase